VTLLGQSFRQPQLNQIDVSPTALTWNHEGTNTSPKRENAMLERAKTHSLATLEEKYLREFDRIRKTETNNYRKSLSANTDKYRRRIDATFDKDRLAMNQKRSSMEELANALIENAPFEAETKLDTSPKTQSRTSKRPSPLKKRNPLQMDDPHNPDGNLGTTDQPSRQQCHRST
jgi:hypothetical protein